jgi:hypothetical protein
MSVFNMYLQLGFRHIVDFHAYDHILFILTLCAVYLFSDWKHIVVLVTAFTIGHSITLALASFNLIYINPGLVEFLIPITILFTAFGNISNRQTDFSKRLYHLKYFTALIFGLIHGMSFSSYLKSLLGAQENIVKPLFAFNIGLEIGQILIVTCILSIATLFVSYLKTPQREWSLILSGAGLGVSVILIIERSGLISSL